MAYHHGSSPGRRGETAALAARHVKGMGLGSGVYGDRGACEGIGMGNVKAIDCHCYAAHLPHAQVLFYSNGCETVTTSVNCQTFSQTFSLLVPPVCLPRQKSTCRSDTRTKTHDSQKVNQPASQPVKHLAIKLSTNQLSIKLAEINPASERFVFPARESWPRGTYITLMEHPRRPHGG